MTCKVPLIGELKARREELGWSLREIGGRTGFDQGALDEWERGCGSPTLDAVEQWAASLGYCLTLRPAGAAARNGLSVDWANRQIAVDGTRVRLTPMEWKALERLAAAPGELVTHQELFCHLYGNEQPFRAQSTAIRVLITKLRRLLPLRIEARWGRGYVVSGIAPSSKPAPSADRPSPKPVLQGPKPLPRDPIALVGNRIGLGPAPRRGDVVNLAHAPLRRTVTPPTSPGPGRAEELSVIERFLAERGATRCPDMATIQRSPLPTLVWDKMKRKWVRPAIPTLEAS